MNRLYLCLALVLVLVAAVFLVRRSPEGQPTETSESSERRAISRSMGPAAKGRSARERLQELLHSKPKGVPAFSTLESLIAELTSEELWRLIEDSLEGSEDEKDPALTVTGWLRAAAFAELGRRAPVKTLAKLDLEDHPKTLYPALFSIYRGWGQVDPVAARAALESEDGDAAFLKLQGRIGWSRQWVFWKSEAYESLFRSWVASDPESAIAALPDASGDNNYRRRAWAGLIGGVEDVGRVKPLMEKWRDEPVFVNVTSRPFGRDKQDQFRRSLDHKRISTIAADRLMETHDLVNAIAYATIGAAADEEYRNLLQYDLMDLHSAKNPDAVIAALGGVEYPIQLAHAVATARPERAVDVLLALPDQFQKGFLTSLLSDPKVTHRDSWYPAPERAPRLPDHEERLGHFRAAVEASTLPPQKKENLVNNLEKKLAPPE